MRALFRWNGTGTWKNSFSSVLELLNFSFEKIDLFFLLTTPKLRVLPCQPITKKETCAQEIKLALFKTIERVEKRIVLKSSTKT